MQSGELFRHIVSAVGTIALLIVLMSKYAQHVDTGEQMVWLWMSLWAVAWIFIMWCVLRDEPLRVRHYVVFASIALAFLALTCAHEVAGYLWVYTSGSPDEEPAHLFARALEDLRAELSRR